MPYRLRCLLISHLSHLIFRKITRCVLPFRDKLPHFSSHLLCSPGITPMESHPAGQHRRVLLFPGFGRCTISLIWRSPVWSFISLPTTLGSFAGQLDPSLPPSLAILCLSHLIFFRPFFVTNPFPKFASTSTGAISPVQSCFHVV